MQVLSNFNHGVGQNAYHLVWKPKYAKDPFKFDLVRYDCEQFLYEIALKYHCDIIELKVMPDHVHLLVEVDPQFGIHRVVKQIKGRSSRLLRQEFPALKSRLPSLWTNSYFVSTVGGAPLEIIKQYIENQKYT